MCCKTLCLAHLLLQSVNAVAARQVQGSRVMYVPQFLLHVTPHERLISLLDASKILKRARSLVHTWAAQVCIATERMAPLWHYGTMAPRAPKGSQIGKMTKNKS